MIATFFTVWRLIGYVVFHSQIHSLSHTLCYFKIFYSVAKAMVAAALSNNPPYCVYFGIEGWMLATLTAGMGPVHGIWDGLMQVLLMGLLRLISLVYLWDFTRIIRNCAKTENNIIKTKEE